MTINHKHIDKLTTSLITVFCLGFSLVGCNQESNNKANLGAISKQINFNTIIPKPVSYKQTDGHFNLSDVSEIYVANQNIALINVAKYLQFELANNVKTDIVLAESDNREKHPNKRDKYSLVLDIDPNITGSKESYQLVITPKKLSLTGASASGVMRGIQTIKQLMTPNNVMNTPDITLRTGTIIDYPRMEYRGFMLDVARHFYTIEQIKTIIDHLAAYKFNIFHLHLTDDQGWRINIPSWPKLTSIGSNSAVGQTQCSNCFYSLAQYEELVKYADERHITLIPEIDVPGHVRAALASYPDELYCEGDAPQWPYTGINVRISSLCFSNPIIYQFFDDVISTIAPLTTGPYIHIGGDETPKWVSHDDFSEFILKANNIIEKHGKVLMGWTNDIGNVPNLSANIVGQHWSTKKSCCQNTLNIANRGSKIVMSPANKTYLDLKYDENAPIGLHWAGYNSIENSYNWDPATTVEGLDDKQIYGVEAALWGETITSMRDAEYMIFPRLLSIAEVNWTPQDKRSWPDFLNRLKQQYPRLQQQDINYRH